MNRHTLVLSDSHLSAILPDTEPGMDHRKAAAVFDEDIAQLIDRASIRSRGVPLEIVFNGDLFDFDAPPACCDFLPDTISHEENGAALTLDCILADHPVFVRAIGRALANGHSIVFVAGNHDAQLVFPLVRRLLTNRLIEAASLYKADIPKANIIFRSLFHHTPDGVHIEHGHSYDSFCTIGVPLPYVENGMTQIEHTVGSVASYYGPAVLRDVDPYAVNPFDVRAHELAAAAWRRIAAGELDAAWFTDAAAKFIQQLAKVDTVRDSLGAGLFRNVVSLETGRQPVDIARHIAIALPKASATRALEANIRTDYGDELDQKLREVMNEVRFIYGCRGVVFGHTHVPWIENRSGVFLSNCGAWSHSSGGTYAWIESNMRGVQATVRSHGESL